MPATVELGELRWSPLDAAKGITCGAVTSSPPTGLAAQQAGTAAGAPGGEGDAAQVARAPC